MKNIDDKILFIAFIIFCAVIIFGVKNCYGENIYQFVEYYSIKWQVDKRVIENLIECESSGNKKAVSNKNCIGLMQVSIQVYRSYFEWKYKKDKNKKWLIYAKAPAAFIKGHLKIAPVCICIGTWHLKQLLIKYNGNYIRALNVYNNGNVDRVSWDYLYKIINGLINFE